ncbi:hypothetical protein C8J57DRAFT_1724674, partial [Mycena rebaudengoi]
MKKALVSPVESATLRGANLRQGNPLSPSFKGLLSIARHPSHNAHILSEFQPLSLLLNIEILGALQDTMPPTTDDMTCGMFQNHQLLLDTMAGSIDAPYTFSCSGISGNAKPQFGPRFEDCADNGFFSLTNLCIGGIKDQHACSVGTCNTVDLSGAVAAPCSSNIMHFVGSQAPGLVTPCCDSDGCTVPSAKYACDASRTLQLCVVDKTAAECVEPSSNKICSGSFSPSGSNGNTSPTNGPNTVSHGFPGTTATSDGSAASQTPTNGLNNTAASSVGHSGLANEDIIAIASVFGTLLVGCLGAALRYRSIKGKKGGITISYFF